MQAIAQKRETLKETLANDSIGADFIPKVIGMCYALKEVLEMELDTTDEEVVND